MKNVFLGLAIAALTFACQSEQKASVEDAAPKAAMECGTNCEKACCAEASECSTAGEQKVCPVTGKVIN